MQFREITTKNLVKSLGKTLASISLEVGLSISMLSKMQNGKIKLTENTKEKFRKVYGVELIETNAYTILQDESNEEVKLLEKKILDNSIENAKLESDNAMLKMRLEISSIAHLPNDFFIDSNVRRAVTVLLSEAKKYRNK